MHCLSFNTRPKSLVVRKTAFFDMFCNVIMITLDDYYCADVSESGALGRTCRVCRLGFVGPVQLSNAANQHQTRHLFTHRCHRYYLQYRSRAAEANTCSFRWRYPGPRGIVGLSSPSETFQGRPEILVLKVSTCGLTTEVVSLWEGTLLWFNKSGCH